MDPFTDSEINDIKKEGETRYENKIPPGYMDADKSDNRYGDLINWKEILHYAKESGKHIIIVSSETKDDWVTKEQCQVVGLRYELVREFYGEVGNSNQYVHYFSLDRFLEFAREKDEKVVTKETVQQVKDYVVHPQIDNIRILDVLGKTSVPVSIESYQKIFDTWKPVIEYQKKMMPEWIETLERIRRDCTFSEPYIVNDLDKKSETLDIIVEETLKKTVPVEESKNETEDKEKHDESDNKDLSSQ